MPPTQGSDPYHGMNQVTAPSRSQPYPGDRSAIMGADMMGQQDFTRYGGHSASSYHEDTGAAMQPHMNQNFGQQFGRQPAAGQSYGQRSSPPYSSPDQYSPPGMMQHRTAAGESFPPSGDIHTIEAMKKSGGHISAGTRVEETLLQTSVAHERFMPTLASNSPKQLVVSDASSSTSKPSPLSSGDLSTHPGQKPVQPTLDAAPYGIYSDTARLVGAKPDQDFSSGSPGGIDRVNVMMGKQNELGSQKPGINLQNLGNIEDMVTQDKVRALEEKLQRAEHERDESKRNMERSNLVLNGRIRRLEEQLNTLTGANNEVSYRAFWCT